MKKNDLKIKLFFWLILLSILIVFNLFTEDYKNVEVKPDTELITKSFQKSHQIIEDEIRTITENINDYDYLENLFFIEYKDLFENKGIGFFIYENNHLTLWSTNDIPLPLSTTPGFFNYHILNLNNGWYSSKAKVEEGFHIVGLLQIKQEYSYQNDLLYKKFNPQLNIGNYYNIIQDSVENAYRINISESAKDSFFLIPKTEFVKEINSVKIFIYAFIRLSLFFFLYYLCKLFSFSFPRKSNYVIVVLSVAIIAVRGFMLFYGFPQFFYELDIFSPQLFAQSFWLPSLGDFLISVIAFFYLALIFKHFFSINRIVAAIKPSIFLKSVVSVSVAAIAVVGLYVVASLYYSLVWNSSISFAFHNILELNSYSLTGLAIILAIVLGFLLVFDKIILEIKQLLSINIFIASLIILILFPVFILDFNVGDSPIGILYYLSFLSVLAVILYVRFKNKTYTFYKYVIIIFLVSVMSVDRFSSISEDKKIDAGRVLAYNLATERDIRAEYFLSILNEEIINDKRISDFIRDNRFNEAEKIISNKINAKRYFNKYDYFITICSKGDSLLIEPDLIKYECFDFFNGIVASFGIFIPESNFYFLDNHTGRISYFGKFNYSDDLGHITKVFIEFHSKLFSEGLGYPELLLEKSLAVNKPFSDNNYAKYHQGKLVADNGDYNYPLFLEDKKSKVDIFSPNFFKHGGYLHFVYYPDTDNVIILSKESVDFTENLVSLSYIFLLLFLVFNLFLFVYHHKLSFRKFVFNLKSKISVSIITLLVISLVVTGFISMFFIIETYEDKQHDSLYDKVNSVLVILENEYGYKKSFDVSEIRNLNELLIDLSNVFVTDINLYDTDGRLLASSRREIYDHGLKGRYLDTYAYNNLIINNSGFIIIEENIDKVNYLSAYTPFRNFNNEVIAYLNLPYFAKPNEFRDEISGFIVTFTNVFLVLILIALIIGIIISKQVTRPLAIIQNKIKQMDINRKTEKIKYYKNDEIGGLVKEYNKKIDELSESVNRLAKSERESAWREMAKQIAHEIKNPLTPMKLRVQHLEQAYNNNDEDFEKTFKNVTNTLVEQIDVLSEIATEFSNFAKLPLPKSELNNIVDIINSSVQLFRSSENIKFITSFDIESEGSIIADKEQMTRVFNNLLKNSMQAISNDENGIIEVALSETDDNYVIDIKDNGKGIDESIIDKMFQPYFTTKSGGMGLGLSIVKNLIENNNGSITFVTEKNIGTTFTITIPKYFDD